MAEYLEEVSVESVSRRPVDDHIGDGENLQQEPRPLVLVSGDPEQALRVYAHDLGTGVVGGPNPHGAGILIGRCGKHLRKTNGSKCWRVATSHLNGSQSLRQ